MIKKICKNQTGMAAIMMTVMILSSILTITMIANTIILNNLAMNITQVDSTKAFFAGEAGAEKILYETRKEDLDFLTLPIPCAVGQGICFENNFASSSKECKALPPSCTSPWVDKIELNNLSSFSLQYLATTSPSSTVMINAIGTYKDTVRITSVEY